MLPKAQRPSFDPSQDAPAPAGQGAAGMAQLVAARLARTAPLDALRVPALQRQPSAIPASLGAYVVTAAATYGRCSAWPAVESPGTLVRLAGPGSGVRVTVACTSRRPACFSATVELSGVGVLSWEERLERSRLGFGSLVLPAVADVTFAGGKDTWLSGYVATLTCRTATHFLPRLSGWLVRTEGEVVAHDSWAAVGRVVLATAGALAGRFIAGDGSSTMVGGGAGEVRLLPVAGQAATSGGLGATAA